MLVRRVVRLEFYSVAHHALDLHPASLIFGHVLSDTVCIAAPASDSVADTPANAADRGKKSILVDSLNPLSATVCANATEDVVFFDGERAKPPLPGGRQTCVRVIEYRYRVEESTVNSSGTPSLLYRRSVLEHAFILADCGFVLPTITRASEKVKIAVKKNETTHESKNRKKSAKKKARASSSSTIDPNAQTARTTPIFDLTTIHQWSERLARSRDFQKLPKALQLEFDDANGANECNEADDQACVNVYGSSRSSPFLRGFEKVHVYLGFVRVIPQRYRDCRFETGELFCYVLDTVSVRRASKSQKGPNALDASHTQMVRV